MRQKAEDTTKQLIESTLLTSKSKSVSDQHSEPIGKKIDDLVSTENKTRVSNPCSSQELDFIVYKTTTIRVN